MLTPRVALISFFTTLFFSLPSAVGQGGLTCSQATQIETGQQIAAPLNQGEGAWRSDAIHARWFYFVAPADGLVAISSCGGGVDTRLQVYLNSCPQDGWWETNDDACSADQLTATRNTYASALEGLFVREADTLFIEWDDHWDNRGFYWNILFQEQDVDLAFTRGLQHTRLPMDYVASGYAPSFTIINRGRETMQEGIISLRIRETETGETITTEQQNLDPIEGGQEQTVLWSSVQLDNSSRYMFECIIQAGGDSYPQNDTIRQQVQTTNETFAQDVGLSSSLSGGEEGESAFAQSLTFQRNERLEALSIYIINPLREDSARWELWESDETGPSKRLKSSASFRLNNLQTGWFIHPLQTPWIIESGTYYLVFRQLNQNRQLRLGTSSPQTLQRTSYIQRANQPWTSTDALGSNSIFLMEQHQNIPLRTIHFQLEAHDDLFESSDPLFVLQHPDQAPDTVPMHPNSNNTWTVAHTARAGDTLYYQFSHPLEGDEVIPNSCRYALSDQSVWRQFIVPTDREVSIPTVCWSSCIPCNQNPNCSAPGLLVCEDFDSYALGQSISDVSPYWLASRPEVDGIISGEQTFSGPNALLIEQGGRSQTDLQLSTTSERGSYALQFNIYLPEGFAGGFSLMEGGEDILNPIFGLLLGTNTSGQPGHPNIGYTLPNRLRVTLKTDTWQQVRLLLDFNRQRIRAFLDGQIIDDRPLLHNISHLRFFSPNKDTRFYVDDLTFQVLDVCEAEALLCESFEWYSPKQPPGDIHILWANTSNPGIMDTTRYYEGNQSLLLQKGVGNENRLFLGGQTSGRYALQWSQLTPYGQSGAFSLIDDQGDPFFTCIQNRNGRRGGEAMVGVFEHFFSYPEEVWHTYRLVIDLELRLIDVYVNGTLALEGYRFRKKSLTYLSFFLPNAFGQTWVDAISLHPLAPLQTEVQFGIDLERLPFTDHKAAYIAGSFTDWVPVQLDQIENQKFGKSFILPAGDTLGFIYLTAEGVREPNEALLECGLSDSIGQLNRLLVVGAETMNLGFPCFGFCSPCSNVTSTDNLRTKSQPLLSVYPNPASNVIQIEWAGPVPIEKLQLWSIQGQIIRTYEVPKDQIWLSGIPSGSYLLRAIAKNQQTTVRIMVF